MSSELASPPSDRAPVLADGMVSIVQGVDWLMFPVELWPRFVAETSAQP
ncbi:MAG: hypothetical protein ACKVVT_01850 [Dehalococcoidia bacterium]